MGKKFKNSVIFSQPWGGLGDNLSCTNLPELFNATGIAFYISTLNYTRNKDIYDLCWGNNEFVKKFKRTIPNIGFKTFEESGYKVFDQKYNVVQNTNVTHGFNPGEGYPTINIPSYIKNDSNEHFEHVLDFEAYSIFNDPDFSYEEESLKEKIKYYSTRNSFSLAYPQLYESNKKDKKIIEVPGLKRLILILLKTNTFVCLNSGSHVLASTIKNITGFPKNIISFNNIKDAEVEITNHSIQNKRGLYYFDNVKYEKINIVKKNHKEPRYKDSQEISKNMSKSLKYHRKLFYYQKKIETIFG